LSEPFTHGRAGAAPERPARDRRRAQRLPARLGDLHRSRARRPRAARARAPHRVAPAPLRRPPTPGPRYRPRGVDLSPGVSPRGAGPRAGRPRPGLLARARALLARARAVAP